MKTLARSRVALAAAGVCLATFTSHARQAPPQTAPASTPAPPQRQGNANPIPGVNPPEQLSKDATGDAAEVLALADKIEVATVTGDVAYASSVLSDDFVMVHGDQWTRGLPALATDDKVGYLKRVQEKQYSVHDIAQTKLEVHGDVIITYGRYVSLFHPPEGSRGGGAGQTNGGGARAAAAQGQGQAARQGQGQQGQGPSYPRLTSIWFERVYAKRNGKWQYLSHRTVHGPTPSPAGIDPTQITPENQSKYVLAQPPADIGPKSYPPKDAAAAEVLAADQKINECILSYEGACWDSSVADTFRMTHGDIWTRGGPPALTDTKQSFHERVVRKQYLALQSDSVQVEMHGDVAITYGRYIATLEGSAARMPDRQWFSVWFERVWQKRDGKWIFLSYRTVHGATYGPTKESVSNR